jgi:putative ABC transport system ATP-binding protein
MDAIALRGDLAAGKGFGTAAIPQELVRLTGVHKFYGRGLTGVHALHEINFQINSGEIVAICGASGSGKTSLLNLINMLESASEGCVVIARLLTSEMSEQARADLRGEMIGLVFQNFSLIPIMTARENVLLPLMLRGHLERPALAAAKQRADLLLGMLGLATQAGQYPARLDSSQTQRVAIARALIARPRLVLADEPTSRLDSGAIRLVMDLFAHEQDQHGTAVVITTRDQRQLSRVTRTLQLAEGRLTNASHVAARQTLRVNL